MGRYVLGQHRGELVGQEDRAFTAVLGVADLDASPVGALHLADDSKALGLDVDVTCLDGSGFTQPKAGKGTQSHERLEGVARSV